MKARFETSKAMTIAGLNRSYRYEEMQKIPEQWHEFGPQMGKVPEPAGKDAYGVSWNQKPGVGMDYMAGLAVSKVTSLPKGFSTMTIPAHPYAIFEHEGSAAEIHEHFARIGEDWFPNSGKEPAEDVPMFERYTEKYCPDVDKGGIELWVPIKK